ncbi:MAG TPA: hypothetical protein VL404_03875 [Candidatus Eisenbacteria bacterium]|nr:hypothetical protein [Candidatus Eisenbacteria bacterium]
MNRLTSRLKAFLRRRVGAGSRLYWAIALSYSFFRHLPARLGLSAPPETEAETAARILASSRPAAPAADPRDIVFFSVRGWRVHTLFESLLAARLRLDGHRVTVLTCEDSLPLCSYGSVNAPEPLQRPCDQCGRIKNDAWGDALPREKLPGRGEWADPIDARVESLDLEGCRRFEYDGAPYGELVHRGLVWHLHRSALRESDVPLYRQALVSAHATRRGLESFLRTHRADTVLMLNGDFCPERVAGWVLAKSGVRFITYDHAFYELFGVGVNQPVWDDLTFGDRARAIPPAGPGERARAEKMLREWRENGGYQGQIFWKKSDLGSRLDLRKKLGLDGRPLAVAYTSCSFEANVGRKDRVFADQTEWLSSLIRFFASKPQFQLVIRVHPAEVRPGDWRSNESIHDFVLRNCAPLPGNVRLVGPGDRISSHRLGDLADSVLVYDSTIGIELAERKKCVITAAHSHYADRGFTRDPAGPAGYFSTLTESLEHPGPLSGRERDVLVDYVAWLFFRRLTPFEAFGGFDRLWPRVNVRQAGDLLSKDFPGVERMARLVAGGPGWW